MLENTEQMRDGCKRIYVLSGTKDSIDRAMYKIKDAVKFRMSADGAPGARGRGGGGGGGGYGGGGCGRIAVGTLSRIRSRAHPSGPQRAWNFDD